MSAPTDKAAQERAEQLRQCFERYGVAMKELAEALERETDAISALGAIMLVAVAVPGAFTPFGQAALKAWGKAAEQRLAKADAAAAVTRDLMQALPRVRHHV